MLAKLGNFDGDDVLTILLSKRETAEFITRKIYRFLVNDNVEESRVKALRQIFMIPVTKFCPCYIPWLPPIGFMMKKYWQQNKISHRIACRHTPLPAHEP